jgi:hypothetical protein
MFSEAQISHKGAILLDLLRQPYSAFFDFSDPRSLAGLRRICEREGLPLPHPDDI